MDLRSELRKVRAAAEKVGDQAVAEGARRRLEMLQDAPDGAGWEWLAAQGDRGAQMALEAERGPS